MWIERAVRCIDADRALAMPGDAAAWPIQGIIRHEIERRINARNPMLEAAE